MIAWVMFWNIKIQAMPVFFCPLQEKRRNASPLALLPRLCYNEDDKGVNGFDGECFGRSSESSICNLVNRAGNNKQQNRISTGRLKERPRPPGPADRVRMGVKTAGYSNRNASSGMGKLKGLGSGASCLWEVAQPRQ